MSNVALTIGGRQFTVACAVGEEDHVRELGRAIDSRLSAMGDPRGQNESRMLLFAALLLADELHEAKSAPAQPSAPSAALAGRLGDIATRLENLADLLEG